jgi:hypothetical protein
MRADDPTEETVKVTAAGVVYEVTGTLPYVACADIIDLVAHSSSS